MIQIKTQELRDAVQAAYAFDKEHGKCTECNKQWRVCSK